MSEQRMTSRFHSSDDMDRLRELAHVTEPVAVVVRPDGSLDVYGHVGIVDQRADVSALPLAQRAPELAELVAMLPAGEWGADELGTLARWLHGLGYDMSEAGGCSCCQTGTSAPLDDDDRECPRCGHLIRSHAG